MDDLERRCKYCNALVKSKSVRCSVCGSFIGRIKRDMRVLGTEAALEDEFLKGEIITLYTDTREHDGEENLKKSDEYDFESQGIERDLSELDKFDNFFEDEELTMDPEEVKEIHTTYTGLFTVGLTAFVPVVGQLVGLILGILNYFRKDTYKKRIGKAFLFNSFIFFVLWCVMVYFLNEYYNWI